MQKITPTDDIFLKRRETLRKAVIRSNGVGDEVKRRSGRRTAGTAGRKENSSEEKSTSRKAIRR